MCGEACAEMYGFSREDQDAYAIETYKRAAAATEVCGAAHGCDAA